MKIPGFPWLSNGDSRGEANGSQDRLLQKAADSFAWYLEAWPKISGKLRLFSKQIGTNWDKVGCLGVSCEFL